MSKQPDPWHSLRKEIDEIKAWMARQTSSSAFSGTGVHPNGAQGLDSDNYVTGVSGFSLNGATGSPEFNDLILRGGIIGDDALAHLVSPVVIDDKASTFAVTTVDFVGNVVPTLITNVFTAPDGFTQALVTASTWGTAVNPNTTGGGDGTGADYLMSRTDIAGNISQAYPTGVSGSNGQNTASSGRSALVTVAPGGTVTVKAQLGSAYQDLGAANTSNGIRLSGTLLWLR